MSNAVSPPESENPGALASATGTDSFGHYKTEQYRQRAKAATALCHAIADCDRDDAVVILSVALSDLSMGSPLPVFLCAMDDARWWASLAAPHELKAYALACFEAMRPKVQTAFLTYVQKSGRVAA